MEAVLVERGGVEIEADKVLQFGADLGPVVAAGEMRAHRRENIAAVKGGRDFRADHPVGIFDVADTFDTVAIGHHGDQAVIGKHKELASLGPDDDCLARAAHSRIDDADENGSSGKIRRGSKEKAGAVGDGKGGDLMGQVDDAQIGRDAVHDAFAKSDRVVDDTEIGHEDESRRRRGPRRRLRADRNGEQNEDQDSGQRGLANGVECVRHEKRAPIKTTILLEISNERARSRRQPMQA